MTHHKKNKRLKMIQQDNNEAITELVIIIVAIRIIINPSCRIATDFP